MIYTVTLNTAIDRLIQIYGKLQRKHNNKTKLTTYDIGGKATHVSVALSMLGIDSIATGFIGGKAGRMMTEMMEEKGVQCEFIHQAGSETRESIILIDETNQGSFMITQPGFTILEDSIKRLKTYLDSQLKNEDIVVFAGSPPSGFHLSDYVDLLSIVKSKGAKLVVDSSGEYLREAIHVKPYLIKPNEFEFQEYVNKKLTSINDFKEALMEVKGKCDYWVVSLGKRGSISIDAEGNCIYAAAPKVQEVNETGAGDFFVGGLVAKIYEKASIEEMLRFASAVGTSKAKQCDTSSIDVGDLDRLQSLVKIERID